LGEHVLKLYEESHGGAIRRACGVESENTWMWHWGCSRASWGSDATTIKRRAVQFEPDNSTWIPVLYGLANCLPCVENAKEGEAH